MDNVSRPNEASVLRRLMVENQLSPRGIRDPKVLAAFLEVPRHEFIPEAGLRAAYADYPLPLIEGQTISQPYIVALMTESLDLSAGDKVLEIGAGSGYQAAILSRLAKEVYTIERVPALAERAERTLRRLGYGNVRVILSDGTRGWEESAPYDAIIVTAAAPHVPAPLLDQLAEGGRLVIPVGGEYSQDLIVLRKKRGEIEEEKVCGCVFVPLIGEHGWRGKDV
jgi:protein-L-isoaspartate(D-aspartate) O-methyltransferase